MNVIEEVEKEYMKQNLPQFAVGDTLKVHVKIIEGDKERLQPFTGLVIAMKGRGVNASLRGFIGPVKLDKEFGLPAQGETVLPIAEKLERFFHEIEGR